MNNNMVKDRTEVTVEMKCNRRKRYDAPISNKLRYGLQGDGLMKASDKRPVGWSKIMNLICKEKFLSCCHLALLGSAWKLKSHVQSNQKALFTSPFVTTPTALFWKFYLCAQPGLQNGTGHCWLLWGLDSLIDWMYQPTLLNQCKRALC